jgi:hypothetical protein
MSRGSELGGRLQAALGDSYDVQDAIVAGGMATVFLARESKADRLVALKVLHGELAQKQLPSRKRSESRATWPARSSTRTRRATCTAM